jgi:hemoglobin-like flavoprotein
MKNPIPSSNMFVTADNLTELFNMLDQYTGEQKALAMQVAMMTLNTCAKIVDEEMETANA